VRPATAGERLYILIRDEILDLTGNQSIRWANIGTLVDDVSGGPSFAEYMKGATAVHATRRALRFWEEERQHLPDESQHVRKVAMFVRREIFPSIGEQLSQRTARAVIGAEWQSHRPISPSCRASMIQKNQRPTCYLCGLSLDPTAAAGSSNVSTP
jgi:NADH pyrophosphatase NudC (nudix superfamily)